MSEETKKSVNRPNRGGVLRSHAEAPRNRFLYTDVTPEEHKRILEYCEERAISVSQFLAELVLTEARKPRSKRKQRVTVSAKLVMTPEEQEKLELLVRMHKKDSLGEYIMEILQPNLDVQRLHAPLETIALRYYLSDEEHDTVMQHVEAKGMAARNYGVMLALKAINKARKKRK
jgi:hypothetical protein